MTADYHELFDLMIEIDKTLSKTWPRELPPENTPGFWEVASRLEFANRSALTAKIRLALSQPVPTFFSLSPIEVWLLLRRFEFVAQFVFECVAQKVCHTDTPRNFLKILICDKWLDFGALSFWNFAMERGGKKK